MYMCFLCNQHASSRLRKRYKCSPNLYTCYMWETPHVLVLYLPLFIHLIHSASRQRQEMPSPLFLLALP